MKKNKSVITRPLASLVAIIIAIELSLSTLGTVLAAPTSTHKAVSRELARVVPATDQRSAEEANKRYSELFRSPEGKYVQNAGVIVGITQMLVSFVIIVALYTRIRKKRLAQDAIAATAFTYTIASIPVMIAGYFIGAWYLGATSQAILPFLVSVVWGSIFSFVISYLIAWVLDKRYTSRHSFEVE